MVESRPRIIQELIDIGESGRYGEIQRILHSTPWVERSKIYSKPGSFWNLLCGSLATPELASLLSALSVEETALTGWRSVQGSPVDLLLRILKSRSETIGASVANSSIKWRLSKHGISCLYHMTHIDNLISIAVLGILPYNKTRLISHATISNWHIQKYRRSLHDYVPLYFATHTPMQYFITHKFAPAIQNNDLVFVELDALTIFQLSDVSFTDGNAASRLTSTYIDLSDLKKLDMEVIQTIKRCYSPEYRRLKAAEVLVKGSVNSGSFLRFVFHSNESRTRFSEMIKRWKSSARKSGRFDDPFHYRLEIDRDLY